MRGALSRVTSAGAALQARQFGARLGLAREHLRTRERRLEVRLSLGTLSGLKLRHRDVIADETRVGIVRFGLPEHGERMLQVAGPEQDPPGRVEQRAVTR